MSTPEPADDSTRTSSTAADPASMIGDYRIIRRIGEGGMGVVFEAEQQHPKRAVALKVIRGGRYVDNHAIKLFQREAQALGRLKHPSIAAIYEAGRTEDGQHFFAMELVRGTPLPEYLRRRPCDDAEVERRLRLFCRICEAVNYAHQRGVIHRDLKPANILVGSDPQPRPGASAADNVPEVKILDFGLARITDADVAATIVTEVGLMQGTLAYMSPEQARGNPDEIDLRTDVYSLGVMLLEALTGHMPYDLPKTGPQAAARVICETPPHITQSAGRRRLGRDLETIVLKALEKEPMRRYQSALALAEDIERYLAKQPIQARPASTIYQMRKLVARHRAAFGFAATLVVLVALFGMFMALQSARVARERDNALAAEKTAKQVSSFLVDLFRISDPTRVRGGAITATEILDRGSARITRDLASDPLVQARLMDTLGQVYDSLGLFDKAQPLLETALATRRKLLGPAHLDVASSLTSNGSLWFHKGDFTKAKSMLSEALALHEKLLGNDDLLVASCLHNLGNVYFSTGSYDQAQRLLERARAIREKNLPPDSPETATTVNTLGGIAFRKGDFAQARQLWEQTLTMREHALGVEHPYVAQTLNNLAVVHTETGDPAGARLLLERVVRIQEKTLGPKHPDLAFAVNNLGDAAMREHDYVAARDSYRRAVDILESSTPNHPELGRFLAGLGRTSLELGDVTAARAQCERSLQIREKTFGRDHAETAISMVCVADCDRRERKYASAEALFERALASCRRPDGQYNQYAGDFLLDYAALLRETGRVPQALEMEKLARSLGSGQ